MIHFVLSVREQPSHHRLDAKRLKESRRGVLSLDPFGGHPVFLGAEIATDRVHDMIQSLVDDVAAGRLKVLIDRTFPLSEAAAAHAYIESRKAVGRVLLIP